MELENFAPAVDIQAEMGAEPPAQEVVADTQVVRIDNVSDEPTEQAEQPEQTEVKEAPKEQKTVPLSALHEARQKNKALLEQIQASERAAKERFDAMEAKLNQLVNPPPEIPSFEDNPAAYLKAKVEMTEAQQAEIYRVAKEQQARTQQEQQIAQITHALTEKMTEAEAEFVQQTPDYLDAMKHLRKVVDSTLEINGETNPARRAEISRQQSLLLVENALRAGQNPAEVAYKFAKAYGWSGRGDAQRISSIAKGTSSTQSLGNSGSKESPLSLAALAQMDDDDFNAAVSDPAKWDKIKRMG